jgi:hypothetical protein
MTQALYAHTNNKTIFKKLRKKKEKENLGLGWKVCIITSIIVDSF